MNRGCIPTKTLVSTVEILRNIQRAKEFGIEVTDYSIDFPSIMDRKDMVSKRLSSGVEQLMELNQVRVVKGEGFIPEPGIVEVIDTEGNNEIITTKNIIIATGSKVFSLPIPGIDTEGVITSDEALSMNSLPEQIIIIGGGVVGIEWACIFNALGVKTTLIEMLPRILLSIDEEIANRLTQLLKRRGIGILTNSKVKEIRQIGTISEIVVSTLSNEEKLQSEKILLAAGRIPDLGNIDAAKLGLELEGNAIKVNEHMMTNIPGIFAAGDVVGKTMLAHVASREGAVAVENIVGKESIMDYNVVPNCVFSFPEVAGVGLTEEESRARYSDVKVSKFPYLANGKALSMGETEGIVKVVADGETSKLLGMHILGAHANDLIAEGALALSKNMTSTEIAHTIHAHPTLSEAIAEAAEGITGNPVHIFRGKV
jgi:dihydrolipoamide dehydrogenase